MPRSREFDRDVVLDRAMRVFWTRGYEAASIQRLVARMGIQRGSVYATFGDKRALFFAALDRYDRVATARLPPVRSGMLSWRTRFGNTFFQKTAR